MMNYGLSDRNNTKDKYVRFAMLESSSNAFLLTKILLLKSSRDASDLYLTNVLVNLFRYIYKIIFKVKFY